MKNKIKLKCFWLRATNVEFGTGSKRELSDQGEKQRTKKRLTLEKGKKEDQVRRLEISYRGRVHLAVTFLELKKKHLTCPTMLEGTKSYVGYRRISGAKNVYSAHFSLGNTKNKYCTKNDMCSEGVVFSR